MQQGRKLQLFARKSSSIVIAPRSPAARRLLLRTESNVSNVRHVIRLLRIWYSVKSWYFFAGAIEFIFVLTIKMEIAGELFSAKR